MHPLCLQHEVAGGYLAAMLGTLQSLPHEVKQAVQHALNGLAEGIGDQALQVSKGVAGCSSIPFDCDMLARFFCQGQFKDYVHILYSCRLYNRHCTAQQAMKDCSSWLGLPIIICASRSCSS
jgi:hypothetical protein